jgi:cell division protein FtsQ
MGVRAPADRRFRRARVKPTRRHLLRRLLCWPALRHTVIVVMLVIGAYEGSRVVSRAPLFRVNQIVVRGNERLPTGEVQALLADLKGQSLLWVDLTIYRARLQASPWVAGAVLRRLLPSTVEVLLSERVPVVIGRFGTQLYLVDENGVLIDEYGSPYADLDLPIVDGLAAGSGVGAKVDVRRAALAARLVRTVESQQDLDARISQVNVADLHDAIVLLEGDPTRIHLGEERFVERLRSYLELSPALRKQVRDIDYVDMRFEDRVYVRPAGTAGTAAVVRRQ